MKRELPCSVWSKMKANNFHYNFLFFMGTNLPSNVKPSAMITSSLINFVIIFHLIFLAILPTIFYIKEHLNDTVNLLFAIFQISGFCSSLLSYIHLCFQKKIVNEVLQEMNDIVMERMKILGENFYENTIKRTEIFIKFPLIFFKGNALLIAVITIVFQTVLDIANGHTDNWFLFFRYKFVFIERIESIVFYFFWWFQIAVGSKKSF